MVGLVAILGYFSIMETFNIITVILLLASVFFSSSSVAIFNHYYERDVDVLMLRTRNRPLVRDNNAINSKKALLFSCLLMMMSIVLSTFYLNIVVTIYIALGAFVYGILYTICLKRYTVWNIVIGGGSASFALLAGSSAVDYNNLFLPLLLANIIFWWTPSHFWALAAVYKDDYARASIPMLPVIVGNKKCAQYTLINTMILIVSSFLPVIYQQLNWIYLFIVTIANIYLFYLNVLFIKYSENKTYALNLFLFSMVYLILIFIAVLLDTNIL